MDGDFSSSHYLLNSLIDKNLLLHLIKLFYSDINLFHPVWVTKGRKKVGWG